MLLLLLLLLLLLVILLSALDFDFSGPLRSGGDGGKNPAGATCMDARRFSPGQDAPSKNPAGSADPQQSCGR
ncbi:hypothetical protein, partial [[Pseudomonas] boreopolis]|uniref:hypothetical protein n=1 Tax=Xanthomonas boreopolis TaxID=86183 RepID=UPI003D9B6291